MWRFALKQTWRDFRAGDLRLLGLAVVVAVAAISSVGFLSDRVGRALERDAGQMLGADLVVELQGEAAQGWIDQAKSLGLSAIRTWNFPSMVGSSAGELQLASVKAVEQGYPLRGQLRTSLGIAEPDEPTATAPEVGKVWVDGQLLALLGLQVGDTLSIGNQSLAIDRVITYEPDRGVQFVNVAPRVLIRAEDLAQSGLVGPGSRVRHSMLVAGDMSAVNQYRDWLKPQLTQAQELVTVNDGRPEITRTLERANEFLTLVVMIAVLIAAVAVALGARRFSQRQQPAIAVMRCCGATQAAVTKLLFIEFMVVALVGSLIGLVIGWAAQMVLVNLMQGFVSENLPGVGWVPALQGLYAGLWLLFAFSLPPLQALRRVSAAQILRHDVPAFPVQSIAGYLLAFIGFAVLMWWIAGNLRYGFGLAAGFVLAAVVFGLLSLGALKVLNLVRPALGHRPAWRFALAGMVRRKASSIAQISALAVGMMAILLLTIVRTDLLQGWQQTVPPDAPNRFLINIQPDQVPTVRAALVDAGIKNLEFYPMIRGRVIERNGQAIVAEDFESPRAQRLLQRDFNLSYADALPENVKLLGGQPLNPNAMELSMEQEVADLLGMRVGDEVVFEVAGQPVPVKMTSVRQVDWDSMQPNFFAVLSTAALKDQPQTFITSFHLPAQMAPVTQSLIRQFPNLTIFDVGALLAQLQSVLDRVSVAIQGLFVFAILAGAIVLAAALSASRHERMREAALLRAIGATNEQLSRAQRIELLGIGALAGLMAATGATLAAWALATWVFEFSMQWSLTPWLLGLAVCMPGAWLAGSLVLRGVLKSPPLLILRNE
ncbi:ABC transporter permease [Orrella daihaiensis]|uniref:FtsX-like permease family protein n=1 Tax=Orrella daihaiensis TaxID=2782176 RepID=A0ABY4AMS6_9BURK|nr:FtsX-like permease family protein [Orrella daihaiensis]UOD51474.1 FtsX-like permease family protein [Orrella daihaiensis]